MTRCRVTEETNDYLRKEDEAPEDTTYEARVIEYTHGIPHELGMMQDIVADVADEASHILAQIYAASLADEGLAGKLIADVTHKFVKRAAEKMADEDSMVLQDIGYPQLSLSSIEAAVFRYVNGIDDTKKTRTLRGLAKTA